MLDGSHGPGNLPNIHLACFYNDELENEHSICSSFESNINHGYTPPCEVSHWQQKKEKGFFDFKVNITSV